MPTDANRKKLLQIVKQRRLNGQARENTLASIHQYMLRNSKCVRSGNFKELCSSDLGLLFQITDEHFFDGLVGTVCERKADRPLAFRLSTRMTSAGGMTTMQRSTDRKNPSTEFEIAIATTPLFATFGHDSESCIVSGRVCQNRLEALQRIMEHEMVHLVEMLLWNDSNCAANPFKNIVRRFFGHTESNHQLLTPSDLAKKRLGIATGDQVTFSIEGQHYTGYVNRITKRATILVEDPRGTTYSDGLKYSKFYVPLNRLRRA
ncbi:MAG: hypothetical protein AB8B55_19255 [Mariniblastus sp.]